MNDPLTTAGAPRPSAGAEAAGAARACAPRGAVRRDRRAARRPAAY